MPFIRRFDRARYYLDLADRLADTASHDLETVEREMRVDATHSPRRLAFAQPRLGKRYSQEQRERLGRWRPVEERPHEAREADLLSQAMKMRVRIAQAIRALADEKMERGSHRFRDGLLRRQARQMAIHARIMGHPGIRFVSAVNWSLDAGEGAFLAMAASGEHSFDKIRRVLAKHAKKHDMGWPFPAIKESGFAEFEGTEEAIDLAAFIAALRYVAASRLQPEKEFSSEAASYLE